MMQASNLSVRTSQDTATTPLPNSLRLSKPESAWLPRLGYAAAAWSLLYACFGLYWALGGGGFPFGAAHDPDPAIPKGLSILSGATQESGAPIIAGGGALCALFALVMAGGYGKGILSYLVVGMAATAALLLAVIIPDSRPLIAAGHIPILLVGKPFGWPEGVSIASQVPWPVLNQGILIIGGLLFGTTALFYYRHVRATCQACGRGGDNRWGLNRTGMTRLGISATWTAAVLPALYALTRWAYAVGIPLGVSSEFLDEMERENPGIWLGGALLGMLAVGGSILTLGLIQQWGEVFPRWVPFLRGNRVPIPLAVVPAVVMSAIATSAGLMLVRLELRDPDFGSWSLTGPGLLWPLWGASLFMAALAYYYRRRGMCGVCRLE